MIRHLITAGCSFSSNGTGGIPPSPEHPAGGCSFIADIDVPNIKPLAWPGMLAQRLNVSSLVNLSAGSHGNILIANNIMSLLQRFKYHPNDTLIVFNISDPGRYDIPCQHELDDKSSFCNWDSSILPFSYLPKTHKLVIETQKHMGIDQSEEITTNSLMGMMSFLKNQGYRFRFMTLRNYTQHKNLKQILNQFQEHMIQLTPGIGMAEFVDQLGVTTDDHFHPTVAGHEILTDKILESL